MEQIGKTINNSQLANAYSESKDKQPIPLEQVDALADELVTEYSNPGFRKWYCAVIYKFGISRVLDWRRMASEGDESGKLFSKYVKQAQGSGEASE